MLISITALLNSCKKDEVITPEDNTGTVEVVFVPMTGANALKLGEQFTTPAGELFSIREMKFFVNNVGLADKSSQEVKAVPFAEDSCQSGIWLVDFEKGNFDAGYGANQAYSFKFKANAGEYADLRFSVEVPREYNLADISKNPYPVNGRQGMYWSWNSGFKFFVINGNSPVVGPVGRDDVHLSIGLGYRAIEYNFRSMLLAAERPTINVEKGKTTRVIYKYDVNTLLTNVDGTPYSFVQQPGKPTPNQVHGGEMSSVLQQNAAAAIEMMDFFINQ